MGIDMIGKQIAAMRKEKGIRQEELAVFAGVSTQAVSKWENKVSHSKSNTKITR